MNTKRKPYQKKAGLAVTAIEIDLDTRGLNYSKWGSEQKGKRGDWLVDNEGDIYTIDAAEFARSYKILSAGRYLKTSTIWAYQSLSSGSVKTLEGQTHYEQGDYVVANEQAGEDAYAISQEKFAQMYERVND